MKGKGRASVSCSARCSQSRAPSEARAREDTMRQVMRTNTSLSPICHIERLLGISITNLFPGPVEAEIDWTLLPKVKDD